MRTLETTRRAEATRILRRCTFGPALGQVGHWAEEGSDALVDWLFEQRIDPGVPNADEFYGDDDSDYEAYGNMMASMLDRFSRGASPLYERMTWYWHTHFTSSGDSAGSAMIWNQHQLIRNHALGNFAELCREITTDPAMLIYLNGEGSRAESPNENHARELLELFTLGLGNFTEDDVKAAAHIMAGWWVDWDAGTAHFEPENAYSRPVTFLGKRRRWSLDEFIAHICAQPACAAHVTRRVHAYLIGGEPNPEVLARVAGRFRESGLDIATLVHALLTTTDFGAETIATRARQPLEWYLAARRALGLSNLGDDENFEPWQLEILGQAPFRPPNVAGWPLDDRWSGASQVLSRTGFVLDWEIPESVIDQVTPTVDAVLDRCTIVDPSPSTRAALRHVEESFSEYDGRLDLLFATALVCPEFSLL